MRINHKLSLVGVENQESEGEISPPPPQFLIKQATKAHHPSKFDYVHTTIL